MRPLQREDPVLHLVGHQGLEAVAAHVHHHSGTRRRLADDVDQGIQRPRVDHMLVREARRAGASATTGPRPRSGARPRSRPASCASRQAPSRPGSSTWRARARRWRPAGRARANGTGCPCAVATNRRRGVALALVISGGCILRPPGLVQWRQAFFEPRPSCVRHAWHAAPRTAPSNNGMVRPAPPTGPMGAQSSTSANAVETEVAEQTNERA